MEGWNLSLREVWQNESADFTPWLAGEKNLRLLGDTLGIELQLESLEKEVRSYRADIVCKDTADESWVLIENQLTATNHNHLGQILAYAAGLDAVTIIWIAERFTDEHRAAMDWLNEISSENVRFFGIEVEVWKIGDSDLAPKFNIVARPNDCTKGGWAMTRIQESGLTDARKLQLEFWRGFREYVLENSKTINPTKPLPQNWMIISIGRSGFKMTAIASLCNSETGDFGKHEFRAQLEIRDKKYAKQYYEAFEQMKDQIEAEFGEPRIWYNSENANMCRIFTLRTVKNLNEGNRDEMYQWILNNLEKLHSVFAERIQNLTIQKK